jgi:hypothetical protein
MNIRPYFWWHKHRRQKLSCVYGLTDLSPPPRSACALAACTWLPHCPLPCNAAPASSLPFLPHFNFKSPLRSHTYHVPAPHSALRNPNPSLRSVVPGIVPPSLMSDPDTSLLRPPVTEGSPSLVVSAAPDFSHHSIPQRTTSNFS